MRGRTPVWAGAAWLRWILQVLSVILGVGVAVACNQILTEDGWSWGWTGIAVAVAAVSALVAYRLTRPPAAEPTPTPDPAPPAPSGQVVEDSTSAGSIDQLHGITGSVRLREVAPASSFVPPAGAPDQAPQQAPSTPDTAAAAGKAPTEGGQQRVSGSQAGGSITQIDGVGGDVTIERS
ncbi:hypothetical protein Pta02_77300 [Planobispora takensis]|uniref:Uncharacterized protein n=2 Tax=Planobispora takensis TaxID=1367882 RepID=A0A8J3X0G4_9ACTN|nr:hypothetical protein Pta02_77300 [Planobispora takensis]